MKVVYDMKNDKICKTVHQYNKYPVAKEDMEKLLEIASDYGKIRNVVYQRYGGVKGLAKLYPGFTIQKEMGKTGLREQFNMPSVYFNIAVLDAVGDIKNQWVRTKEKVLKSVNNHTEFTEVEKHYLRLVLKIPNIFEAVLNQKPVVGIRADIQKRYDEIAAQVEPEKLNKYLRRVVRKKYKRPYAEKNNVFSLSERAYRYENHGIYITTKESRKRIFIELTDSNTYVRQITLKLYPMEQKVEILVPVDVKVKHHPEYDKTVGLAVGMYTMLVTDTGNIYGEKLGDLQIELAEWSRIQTIRRASNGRNVGKKEFVRKKQILKHRINMELNRFLRNEQPQIVYLPKLPRKTKSYGVKHINHSVNLWQRGYIRKRLRQKCQEHSVEFVEVFAKDISNTCSSCDAIGEKKEGIFYCKNCGFQLDEKVNSARNALKRGQ